MKYRPKRRCSFSGPIAKVEAAIHLHLGADAGGIYQDQSPHTVGMLQREAQRRKAAHGVAEEIYLVQAQRVKEAQNPIYPDIQGILRRCGR